MIRISLPSSLEAHRLQNRALLSAHRQCLFVLSGCICKQLVVNLPGIPTTIVNLHNLAFVDTILYIFTFSVNHHPSSMISSLSKRLMAYISSTLRSALHLRSLPNVCLFKTFQTFQNKNCSICSLNCSKFHKLLLPLAPIISVLRVD